MKLVEKNKWAFKTVMHLLARVIELKNFEPDQEVMLGDQDPTEMQSKE